MARDTEVQNEDVKILFQGSWSAGEVDVDEVSSARAIDNDLEKTLISSWDNTLHTANEQGKKIWDSVIYRFEDCEMSSQKLHLHC